MVVYVDNTHWEYDEEVDPAKFYGFIYIIENELSGRRYLGRKAYKVKRTTTSGRYKSGKRKGKIRYKKYLVDSGWSYYTGSSKDLNADIAEYGKDNFRFTIFNQYKNRGGLVYYENYYLYTLNTLTETFDDGDRVWYNKHIGGTKFIPPIEGSESSRYKMKNNKNAVGAKRSAEFREQLRKANLGKLHSESTRQKIKKYALANSPNRDETMYTFVNDITDATEYCRRVDLTKKYNLNPGGMTAVMRGKSRHKGWRLQLEEDLKLHHQIKKV